jgi:hypothetical protein
VLEAKKSIVLERPSLVLVRASLPSERRAAERLAGELWAHPEFRDLLVAGLFDKDDAPDPATFSAEAPLEIVMLPVEFPRFSRMIEELLGKAKVRASDQAEEEEEDVLAAARQLHAEVGALFLEEAVGIGASGLKALLVEVTRRVCEEGKG